MPSSTMRKPSAEEYFPTPQTVAGKVVSDFYQWPVLFAVLPPLLTLVYGGKVEEWSEGFMLLVVAFYLYGLVKGITFTFPSISLKHPSIVPWELYIAARVNHSCINKVAMAYSTGELDPTSSPEVIRQSSVWKLWTLEWLYFLLVFASPLGGAIFLRYIRPHLHVYQNLINDFPMALYVLTAYIRPLIHLIRLFKSQASNLQEEINYPNIELSLIKQKLNYLEKKVEDLTMILTESRAETAKELRDAVEPNLKVLNKDLRRSTQREQKFIDYSIARFRELELRLQEQEMFVARNKEKLETFHNQNLHTDRFSLFTPAYWLIDNIPNLSVTRAVTIPLNIALKVSTWWIPSSVKQLLNESITGPKKRPSITDGSENSTNKSHHQQILSPSPLKYPWDPATRKVKQKTPIYHDAQTTFKG